MIRPATKSSAEGGLRMKSAVGARYFTIGAMLVILTAGCATKKPPLGAEGQGSESDGARGSLADQMAGRQPGEDGPLRDVHFDYDRHDLRSEDRQILQGNAQWLKDNPKAKVEIEGHC